MSRVLKGSLKKKSEKAGMPMKAFAVKHKGDKSVIGKQARMALVMQGNHGSVNDPTNPKLHATASLGKKLYGG